MATVKTIRLEIAYQNEWGKILWNREWRIFTVEVDGEDDDEKSSNFKNLIDEFHNEISALVDIIHESSFDNKEAIAAFKKINAVQLFMSEDNTYLVMDRGPWDADEAGIRQAAEHMIGEAIKAHPELRESLPPQLRHRFK